MNTKIAPLGATCRVPSGDGIVFCVWADDLGMYVHVERSEAVRILEKRPDFEFVQDIFGQHISTMAFIQRKRGEG